MIDPRELAVLSKLLDVALDLPDAAARQAWIAQLDPKYASLRPRLESLLAANAPGSPTLDRGIAMSELLGPGASAAHATLAPGTTVGPWRLLLELGTGGMSVVWLAERILVPSEPRVALKLPAISLDSGAFLARFERERGFLASLDHPGIARLVEAGVTEQGQHFLALEYVDGLTLTGFCNTNGLGVRARLELFLQVLDAVGHAHSRAILHRDLKPSNVLVTPAGEVRLLDFGIAKLLIDGHADETELTALWGRALTRDYASPEQLAGRTVGMQSDIFALGVVLYELLCGGRPYRGSAARLDPAAIEAQRRVPPPPPSEACAPGTAVAEAEGGVRKLARRLAGDLDAIALRSLRHDPAERYPDAAAMAADVRRVLADEPVQSRLQHWRFTAGRAARRHGAAGAVATILLLAIAGLGSSHKLAADIEAALLPPVPEAMRTVLVTIGDEDHRRLFGGASPLDAGVMTALVKAIMAGRPAALGVDIDTSGAPFAAIREKLDGETMRRIVWARDVAASEAAHALPLPRPVLGRAEAAPVRSGLALALVDGSTGTVRWWRRSIVTTLGPLPTVPFELLRDLERSASPGSAAGELSNISFVRSERLELPASVVLAPGFDWAGRIQDRVVLLGGRYDRADMHPTPLGLKSGLDILADTTETERSGRAYPRPSWLALLLVGLADLIAVAFLFDRLPRGWAAAASLALGLTLAGLLAATGILAGWPYSVMAAFAVVAAQLATRGVFDGASNRLLARLRFRRGARPRPRD